MTGIQQNENVHADNGLNHGASYTANLEEEIRKLSARLHHSESGKSQFLSNVRNEINNPMASIIGLAASIVGLSTEEKVKRMSSLIQKQATQLDFQMRNIIIAAEIELGALYPSPSRVNVNSLIEGQVSYFNHTVEEQNIEVTLRMTDHLRFRTDSQMLQTICLNLIANAIEFCGGRKQVVIEAGVVDGYLEISVIDFGAGLTLTQQTEMFQRFSQLESGVCKKHKGHGLGLCIVNELINQLQGTLSIDSQSGSGTRVTIKLPELISGSDDVSCSSNGNESLFNVDEEF
jgi:signal transduction histidine kinase